LDGSLEYDSFFYVTNLVPLLAENESLETDKNTALTEINVLTNDCGTYAYILSFATNGTIGQVTLNDDGTFTYNPAPLVNGIPTTVFPTLGQGKTATDTFTYTIIDAAGHTAVGTITVTVDGVNDAPTPSNPIITRLPGTNEVLISVASLGGDPDGDLVTLVSFNATTTNGGKVTLSGDNLIFIPHDDHSTDAFNYTLSDPYDATVVGRVLITVDPLSNPGVIAIQPVADDFVCAFRAQPAQTYIVEESDNAAGPWTVVGPAAANSNGTYTFRDTDASPTQRFFRIVTQ
jgi:VCBS repeat-containing protein